MSWILDHFSLIVFLVIVFTIGRKVRAILKDAEEQANRRGGKRPMANFDPDEAERVRRIQEEIRRKIAERRGGVETPMPTPPPLVMERTSMPRPQNPPATDPFGGPMKRILTELERRVNERSKEPPVVRDAASEETEAQLKRQRELAKKLEAAREAREARRQDSEMAGAVVRQAPIRSGDLTVKTADGDRGELLGDLRDPRGLRRAFVLREVLGAPVGLR